MSSVTATPAGSPQQEPAQLAQQQGASCSAAAAGEGPSSSKPTRLPADGTAAKGF